MVKQIVTGGSHTCALLDGGTVRCWGAPSPSLGYQRTDTIGDSELPYTAGDIELGGTAIQITTNQYHTCALLTDGAVRCWGDNEFGQLGIGNTLNIGDDEYPKFGALVQLGDTAIQVAAGGYHTCALLSSGDVRCWGYGENGQLGTGRRDVIGMNDHPSERDVIDLGGKAVQIATGRQHSCALLTTGAVRCWGAGGSGRLGYGNTDNLGDDEDETPAALGDIALGGVATQIAAGDGHTCALLTTGALRCWGAGTYGQLGYANTRNVTAPVADVHYVVRP